MAISLRLDTRRRTVVATATRLPRYARNDIRGQSKDSAAHAYPLYSTTNVRCRLTCTHFTPPPTGAAGSLVPALICHCEERPLIPSSSRDVAISLRLDTRRRTVVARRRDCRATLAMTLGDNRKTLRLTRTHFTPLPTGAAGSLVPALICHCEERSEVAISLRLDTRRRTVVATATRLPRYARNDIRGQSKDSAAHTYPLYFTTNGHCRLTCTHFTPPPTGAAGSLVPALICHCEERPLIPSSSRDVAISLRLANQRRYRDEIATLRSQ